jgi:hypothetical protein
MVTTLPSDAIDGVAFERPLTASSVGAPAADTETANAAMTIHAH